MLRICALTLTGLAVLLTASPSSAQTAAERAAAAQVLFDDALKLTNAGHYAEACPKFKSAQDLDPGMATQFRLADCYEHIGKTASAWALYVEVADAAKAEKNVKREAVARKRATALEPRLARMTITVPPDLASLAGLQVKRDGILIEKTLWRTAVPVDPGEHTISATAPGKKPWEGKGVVGMEPSTTEVTIPLLDDLPKEAPPPASYPLVALPVTGERRSLLPVVIMSGVAVAAAGAGVAFILLSQQKQSEANNLAGEIRGRFHSCIKGVPNYDGGETCNTLANTVYARYDFRDTAIGAFIGAGAAAIGAATYLAWPLPKQKTAHGINVFAIPVASAHEGGLILSGSF